MNNNSFPRPDITGLCVYSEPMLAQVVTLQEASYLWQKSQTALTNAIMKGRIDARKSVTGGTWLLATGSIIKHYGTPVHTVLDDLLDPKHIGAHDHETVSLSYHEEWWKRNNS